MNRERRIDKSSDLIVAAELTRRGLDVYLPCVDDQDVELVVRVVGPDRARHFDIQVKPVCGYNRIFGIRIPENRTDEFILVLHLRHEDRSDEFYFLTGAQVERRLCEGSAFRELAFDRPEREQYAQQDLRGLADHLRDYSVKPGVKEIQRAALRYVIRHIGDAVRVCPPVLRGNRWIAEILGPDDTPAGEISLTEWGDVDPAQSATFESARSRTDALRSSLPAA